MVKVKKQTVCRGGFNVERLREKEWEDRLFTQSANSQTFPEESVQSVILWVSLLHLYITITADLIKRAIDRTHDAFF